MAKAQTFGISLVFATAAIASAAGINDFTQTNLTSDLPGIAAFQDANLTNPWGLTSTSTSPFWAADNGTGMATIYNGTGAPQALVVTIPPAQGSTGTSDPTGIVANTTSGFAGSHFIFDTESGTVAAWTSGTNAALVASGAAGSVYKGLGIGGNASGNLLYAANFGLGRIDVYDSNFKATTVAGNFTDPTLPSGYAPFNIQNIGGQLYVTFAKSSGGKDEEDGPGLGFVDAFDMDGHFIKRVASQGALNAPWGLALAPAQFGAFGGDLLVGNFADGMINAYNLSTGLWDGVLEDSHGNPISNPGLWGLSFGNGAQGQDANTLYFNAGIAGPDNVEDHGLFGSIAVATTPEPGPVALMLVGFGVLMAGRFAKRRQKKQAC